MINLEGIETRAALGNSSGMYKRFTWFGVGHTQAEAELLRIGSHMGKAHAWAAKQKCIVLLAMQPTKGGVVIAWLAFGVEAETSVRNLVATGVARDLLQCFPC